MPTTSLDVSKLRARYMSTVYTDWPQHYVQLALVKEERGTRSDKDIEEIAKLTLRGQIDEVLLRKEPLHDLNDIFHYQNKPCPRIILIVGGPGKSLASYVLMYIKYIDSNITILHNAVSRKQEKVFVCLHILLIMLPL